MKRVAAFVALVILILASPATAYARGVAAPPGSCRRETAEAVVRRFISAYNSESEGKFNETIASEARFGSYGDARAVAGAIPFTTTDRGTLWSFVAMRQDVNEEMRLDELELRWNPERRLWNFQFKTTKVADDILVPGGVAQYGKGAFAGCKISIWNTGQ